MVLAAYQVLGIAQGSWALLNHPGAEGKILAWLMFKVIILAVFAGIAIACRYGINRKWHRQHPEQANFIRPFHL